MDNDIDFFGNKINVGDIVAFMEIKYRTLKEGVIKKKNAQMVEIEYTEFNGRKNTARQYYSQVIKKTKEETNE